MLKTAYMLMLLLAYVGGCRKGTRTCFCSKTWEIDKTSKFEAYWSQLKPKFVKRQQNLFPLAKRTRTTSTFPRPAFLKGKKGEKKKGENKEMNERTCQRLFFVGGDVFRAAKVVKVCCHRHGTTMRKKKIIWKSREIAVTTALQLLKMVLFFPVVAATMTTMVFSSLFLPQRREKNKDKLCSKSAK